MEITKMKANGLILLSIGFCIFLFYLNIVFRANIEKIILSIEGGVLPSKEVILSTALILTGSFGFMLKNAISFKFSLPIKIIDGCCLSLGLLLLFHSVIIFTDHLYLVHHIYSESNMQLILSLLFMIAGVAFLFRYHFLKFLEDEIEDEDEEKCEEIY